jgi:glycerate dehydrogenase
LIDTLNFNKYWNDKMTKIYNNRFKITVLDGGATNPGDLSWDKISELGILQIYDYTPQDLVVQRSMEADAILVGRTLLDKTTISQLYNLKLICTLGTGFNMIDTLYCSKQRITVCNVAEYSTISVAQHIFALLLSLTNKVNEFDNEVRAGAWSGQPKLSGQPQLEFLKYSPFELSGKTLGIIGFGCIGRQVAKIAQVFGMRCIATSRTVQSGESNGIQYGNLEFVLENADVISLNCPLNEQTRGLINSKSIALMKKGAIIINTSRGEVIDEAALALALNEGYIKAAALDVLANEPNVQHSPLLSTQNCIITPHIAWASKEARERLIEIVSENIKAYLNGKPQNRVV